VVFFRFRPGAKNAAAQASVIPLKED
ncbi:CcoQ/FixQ family Cbb3-type cytochrome c oxidase assembly chaperone, partial [Sinorhizobium meliloti]